MKKLVGLVLNVGSSSLKIGCIEFDESISIRTSNKLFEARAVNLGTDDSKITSIVNWKKVVLSSNLRLNHAKALERILDEFKRLKIVDSLDEIDFIGHRIVHGGPYFSEPTCIDDDVIEKIKKCIPLAPLHNPAGLEGIRICRMLMPNTRQYAIFDTAFHQSIPEIAHRYAIPEILYQKGVRKYGFHGTSYAYLTRRTFELLDGKKPMNAIIAHIGQGASVCAIKDGKAVYTSMEFSPLSGCLMGTRSGSLDPTVLQFMDSALGYTLEESLEILNKRSGLLGISGISSNMVDIINGATDDNYEHEHSCKLALDMFCISVAEQIAKGIIHLGCTPMQLIFSAGIGENSPLVRKLICDRLIPLIPNLILDKKSNQENQLIISSIKSDVGVFAIPTDEELEIALECALIPR